MKLWYHSSESMISVTSDIIGLWYQAWYWPWYHNPPTCNVRWQITEFRIWNDERFQCEYTLQHRRAWPMRGAGWSLEVLDGVCPTPGPRTATSPRSRLAMSDGRHRPPWWGSPGWSLEVLDGVHLRRRRPAPVWQRRSHVQGWRWHMIAAAPPRARRRDEDWTVLVVWRVRNRETRWRRSPSAAAAPRAVGGGAGAGAGGRGVASPAPEPSLGLASHVSLERLVSSLLQHCKRGGVPVIADGGNPAVAVLEVRSGRKEGTGRTRWAICSPLWGRRGAGLCRNLRAQCCTPRGPSWSGTGRLHVGDNDNGVRMRCGRIRYEIEKI